MERTLFKNKFRIASIRLKDWDYAQDGMYFLTINARYEKDPFGQIVDHNVYLNKVGMCVEYSWNMIPNKFAHAYLDEFIVMPDHVHGIIGIRCADERGCGDDVCDERGCRDAINRVSTHRPHHSYNPSHGGVTHYHNPMGTGSVGELIRWFKGRCTYEIHAMGFGDFKWQPRFYDRIIRNETELKRIRLYITENPEHNEEHDY